MFPGQRGEVPLSLLVQNPEGLTREIGPKHTHRHSQLHLLPLLRGDPSTGDDAVAKTARWGQTGHSISKTLSRGSAGHGTLMSWKTHMCMACDM